MNGTKNFSAFFVRQKGMFCVIIIESYLFGSYAKIRQEKASGGIISETDEKNFIINHKNLCNMFLKKKQNSNMPRSIKPQYPTSQP